MMSRSIIKDTIVLDSYTQFYEEEKAGNPPCTLRGFTDSERIELEQKCKYVRIVDKSSGESFTREISHIKHAPMYNFSDGRQPIVISWKHPDPSDEILSHAISHYGEPANVLKCIEELAELGEALCDAISASDNSADNAIYYTQTLFFTIVNEIKAITEDDGVSLCINPETVENATEELADAAITTTIMQKMFTTPEEFEKVKQAKLNRLKNRMQNIVVCGLCGLDIRDGDTCQITDGFGKCHSSCVSDMKKWKEAEKYRRWSK